MALKLKGSTSGFVAIDAPSVAGNNTLILPENTGSAQQLLGNDITAGVVTFTSVTVNRNGDLTVPGTISIGGTLTYEDVTSVDSVGIVTARGLSIFGNTTGLNVASGISTFQGISLSGNTTGLNVASGISTFVDIASRNINSSGVVTATSFVGALPISNDGNDRVLTSSGSGVVNAEANLTMTGTILTFNTTANTHRIQNVATGDHYTVLEFDSNRASAGNELAFIDFQWDGDKVADIMAVAGSDTTNKDDGHLVFRTSASQGSITERLRITSTGEIGIGNNNPGELLSLKNTSAQCNMSLQAATDGECAIFLGDTDSVVRSAIKHHNTGDYLAFFTGGNTERLRIDSSGKVGINCTPQEIFHVKAASETITSRDGVLFGSTDSLAADKGLPLVWTAHIGTDADYGIASICGRKENATSDNGAGYLQFGTGNAPGAIAEKMRLTSAGQLLINRTSSNDDEMFAIFTDSTGPEMMNLRNNSGGTKDMIVMMSTASSAVMMRFKQTGGLSNVGSITTSSSATAYNTSSDYRLKENVVAISDGITRLKTLKPYRFNFKVEPGKTVDGFLAHEVTAVPEAIHGEKDAVETTYYTDGDTIPEGKSVGDVKEENAVLPQSLDYSKLTPLLTAALQEAITKIETLESTVTNLQEKVNTLSEKVAILDGA